MCGVEVLLQVLFCFEGWQQNKHTAAAFIFSELSVGSKLQSAAFYHRERAI